MAASQTEVVNLALSEIGASTVLSIDDPVKGAILAKLHWRPTVEAVLRAYPWNCAVKTVVLAAESTKPTDTNWSNQFLRVPEDVRVRKTDASEWAVSGRRILANATTLAVQYTEYNDDVTSWDPLLVQAVTARLAHVLAFPLVQSGGLRDSMWEAYRIRVREARSIDAQEGSGDQVEANDWLEGRN